MNNAGLPVHVSKLRTGTLTRAREEARDCVFSYQEGIRDEFAVSLTMPIQPDPYVWERGMHPVFDMNMPEGHLRLALISMFRKAVKGFDAFQLLNVIGPYQLGRVTAGQSSAPPMPETSVRDLLLHDGAQDLFDDLLSTYAAYSGVSGVQPKVLVRDETGGDIERLTHKGATHIVKSWQANEFPQLATNEYFCLRAAKHAGINVAKFDLSAGGRFLVVERFDVSETGYLGFEDFCVLNGMVTDEKYDSSYEACARMVKAYLPQHKIAHALRELFINIALSAAIQNGDAHLKNFGLLYDHAGADADIDLAPAFDLITTTAYKQRDIMALSLAGSKNWPKHKLLYQFGRIACGLTDSQVTLALEQVADGISKAAVELREHIEHNEQFKVIGERMLAAWDWGTMRCLADDKRPRTNA
ncbi:MAG TPA: type II toxin-antitoxin system HipA family toxin [Pseudomonas xinjiangensis]|uniref:Type II toxin-antitoxin system HipA family toxin n=2 Tax=root TaxID=1 RepID=A0A7V1BPZ1_9GAMM|nr:type II toxin-antitoxin system HipA family toxin [Halopseudomonas xinjiangensis]HEC48482.1 type II toxin-antitoxin system HipA family toxin [Halopseudomonas xinjiangensis]